MSGSCDLVAWAYAGEQAGGEKLGEVAAGGGGGSTPPPEGPGGGE
ncbi:MAG TPA: 1,4-beta-xylanase, partial [Gammaproteobacteria bacterium]|nr:1,4-beta-xylanase [Gammaproteobacteria bacterium]